MTQTKFLGLFVVAMLAASLLSGPAKAVCPTYTFAVTGQFPHQSGTTTDTAGNVWVWDIPAATSAVGNLSFTPQSCADLPITFNGSGRTVFCNTSPCSMPYTVNTGSNALLINVGGNYPACWGGNGVDDVTAVTFDGVVATPLAKRVSNINQRLQYVYGLLNPHVGQHNIQVTWTGNNHNTRVNAVDYGNVSGFGAVVVKDHGTGNCGIDTTMTTPLTTTAPNSWIYLGMINSTNNGPTGDGTNTIYRGDALDYVSNFDNGASIVAPGIYNMTTNSPGSSQSMSHIAVELKR